MRPFLAILALLSTAAMAKPPITPAFTIGGTGGIVRAEYTVTATTKDDRGNPAIALPSMATVYVLPISAELWSESPDFVAWTDGTLEIKKAGLYTITANVDWVAQDGSDCYPRKVTIAKMVPGASLGERWEGGLLNIHSVSSSYWRLAGADIHGVCAVQAATGEVGRGSTDGWHTLSTAPIQLVEGDRVFATISSRAPGAKFQATNMTSLQITRWALSEPSTIPERKTRTDSAPRR